MEHDIAVGGTYRHFKGTLYTVIAVAQHSVEELHQLLVIFMDTVAVSTMMAGMKPVDGRSWARPVEEWEEEVDKPDFNYKGKRFVLIDAPAPGTGFFS